jgi:hypothetical protein
MALFSQYTAPGTFVRDSVEEAGITLFGDARIPVFIGEGQETRSFSGINLHRGSSATSDEMVIRENLSAQVDGTSRTFQLTYFPVVTGDGKGVATNDPSFVKLYANDLPILVTSLNGETGVITTQSVIALGTDLRADYFFKRMDTYIANEDLSAQVPTFASATVDSVLVAPSVPGSLSNAISIALVAKAASLETQGMVFTVAKGGSTGTEAQVEFVSGGTLGAAATGSKLTITVTGSTKISDVLGLVLPSVTLSSGTSTISAALAPGHVNTESVVAQSVANLSLVGATDAQAVTGIGTDAIVVELVKEDGSARTRSEVASLLSSGISTLSGGTLSASVVSGGSTPASVTPAVTMTGGNGPSTNRTFKLNFTPVVDGTNGGVVTTNPDAVVVLVNDSPVKVVALNGLYGVVTLAQPVAAGAKLTASYYTNNYQDTFDVLPGDNITELTAVGYGVGRSDFIEGVDFVLETDEKGARIQWGASVSTKAGNYTAGYTPFDGSVITPTLLDEYVYLRPVTGVVDGRNSTFQMEDVPTDGGLLSRPTDDPSKIAVYVGLNPVDALSKGPVRVVSLNGSTRTFQLYTPPSVGQSLYTSFWRSALNDHKYTLSVVTPGVTEQGTYKIANENGEFIPVAGQGTHDVKAGAFANTGIVWPHNFSDLRGQVGATPDETITLTFQDDGLTYDTTVAVQAYTLDAAPGLRFRATNVGSAVNGVTQIVLRAGSNTPDASAVTKVDEVITIDIKKMDGSLRKLEDIIALFAVGSPVTPSTNLETTLAGKIICEPSSPNTNLTTSAVAHAATALTGGVDAVSTPYAIRFKVTSSRTTAQMLADSKGRTGNAQTPVTPNVGVNSVGLVGYVGQTYIDPVTAVQFTVVDPTLNPLSNPEYGWTSAPSPAYRFVPGDKIVFTMNSSLARKTSAIPTIDVPGLRLKVTSTYNMETGSTATVQTYNKAGQEPKIGEFYFVDYKTAKTAKDFEIKIFNNITEVYTEYGQPSPLNKLSLAARLFNQNGGQTLACIQVPKQLGMDIASDQAFMAAIESLAQPLPGSENKANVIVPLTTSAVVQQFLSRHLITQGSQRMGGEGIGYIGFSLDTAPTTARSVCRAIKSDRIIAAYPGGAILSLEIDGKSSEFAVGGEFLAAALAGMDLNPAYDVATSLTRKNIVGFDRLIQRYDNLSMDLAAADGLCWLVERSGALQVRHYQTTDPSNPITREPSNRKVADEAHFRLRRNLDQFIARKILTSLVNDITVTTHATMKSMIEQELVENYKDLSVVRDAYDPTVIHVSLKFKPVFSLMWLDVNLTVTTRI